MRQAADEGDMAKLQELIDQVEETDAATARKLRKLAAQYDYEKITQMLATPVVGKVGVKSCKLSVSNKNCC